MKNTLLFVLDTNQFLIAAAAPPDNSCLLLIDKIISLFPAIKVCIPQTIFKEVRKNLHPRLFTHFIKLLRKIGTVEEDSLIPFELVLQYENIGLKPADAFIAAFCEWIEATALVSENRHFLSRQINLPFKVLTASQCLRTL